MSMKKAGIILLGALSLAAMLGGCSSSSKDGGTNPADVPKVSEALCAQCHGSAVSSVTGKPLYEEFFLSKHKTSGAGIGCQDCHGGGSQHNGVGPMPFPNPDASLRCGICHTAAQLGTPHFGNNTTGGQQSSYVSFNNVGKCRNCHNPHNPIVVSHREWALSGHGDVTGSWDRGNASGSTAPWKSRGNDVPAPLTFGAICVRCHTATGYIKYIKSGFTDVKAWGTASDKTKEILSCNACHDDGNGNAYAFIPRNIPVPGNGVGLSVYYNYSAQAPSKVKLNNVATVYPDAGISNLCVVCHVGREIGEVIKRADAAQLNFSSVARISQHDFVAGANLFQKGGFLFYTSATMYPNVAQHDQIGIDNFSGTGTKGPCITCHMSAPSAADSGKHFFLPVTKDASGVVTAVVTAACDTCHGVGGMTAASIEASKAGQAAALDALTEAEVVRGTVTAISGTGSKTYVTNWNRAFGKGVVPGSRGEHAGAYTMGTAFNWNLLENDPGSFAHNSIYARELIYDSIDWLNDGVMNQDVEAAINALPTNARLTDAEKAAAIVYLMGGPGGPRP